MAKDPSPGNPVDVTLDDLEFRRWAYTHVSKLEADMGWVMRLLIPILIGLAYVALHITFHI